MRSGPGRSWPWCSPFRCRSPGGGRPTAGTTQRWPCGSTSARSWASCSAPGAPPGCSGLARRSATPSSRPSAPTSPPNSSSSPSASSAASTSDGSPCSSTSPPCSPPASSAGCSASACAVAASTRRETVVILVLDIGTTSARAAVVDDRLAIVAMAARPFPPATPFPGLVEFDPVALVRAGVGRRHARSSTSSTSRSQLSASPTSGRARSCGTARPASRSARRSAGRTCGRSVECIMAKASHDLTLAPNQSATKLAWLLDHVDGARDRDLCFGTVDTWVAWTLVRRRSCTSPTTPTPASPACWPPTDRRGTPKSSTPSGSPRPCFPHSSTPPA